MHDISLSVIIIAGMMSSGLFSASSETIFPVASVAVRSLEGRS